MNKYNLMNKNNKNIFHWLNMFFNNLIAIEKSINKLSFSEVVFKLIFKVKRNEVKKLKVFDKF